MIHSIGITSLQFDKFDKKIGSQISTKNPLVKKKIGLLPDLLAKFRCYKLTHLKIVIFPDFLAR